MEEWNGLSPELKRWMRPCRGVPASVEVTGKYAGAVGTGKVARTTIRDKGVEKCVWVSGQSGAIQEKAFDFRMKGTIV